MEKIAVIMSLYKNDRVEFLKQSIESVLNQTYSNFDLYIQCDGVVQKECNDYLSSLKDERVHLRKRQENKGLAKSLNEILKEEVLPKNYEYIARMDADDICFLNRFEIQLSFLIKNDLDIVGGQIIEFGKDINDIISERIVPVEHKIMVKYLKKRSPFSHPTIILKSSVYKELKGYDSIIFPEDYDFFVRAYLKGYKFGNVNDKVLYFRVGEDKSKAIKRRWGRSYAYNEFKLYKNFLKIGFYNKKDFFIAVSTKIPIRFLPFPLFKYLYFNVFR